MAEQLPLEEIRRRLGLDPDYDWRQWQALYAKATHKPLTMRRRGDVHWTVFTVDRAIAWGEAEAQRLLRP